MLIQLKKCQKHGKLQRPMNVIDLKTKTVFTYFKCEDCKLPEGLKPIKEYIKQR